MTQAPPELQETSWLDQPIARWFKTFDLEKVIFIIILLLAILSRFYILV